MTEPTLQTIDQKVEYLVDLFVRMAEEHRIANERLTRLEQITEQQADSIKQQAEVAKQQAEVAKQQAESVRLLIQMLNQRGA